MAFVAVAGRRYTYLGKYTVCTITSFVLLGVRGWVVVSCSRDAPPGAKYLLTYPVRPRSSSRFSMVRAAQASPDSVGFG